MKREELKEKIKKVLSSHESMVDNFNNAVFTDNYEDVSSEIVFLIDEYTKPKTKKKSLEERKQIFIEQIDCFRHEYGIELIRLFYEYWSEHNEGGSKMRFEMSKNQPFNIRRRLATWKKNQKNYNNGNKPTTTQNRNATEDDINNYINS